MKRVLIIIPGFIPSTIIGVLRPLAALEGLGELQLRLRLSQVPILCSRDIDWCDIAVFCRNSESKDLLALYELKKKGKKVIYEVDDNFEEISLETEVGRYHRAFFRLHGLRRFFALADITRVYSIRLQQRATEHGARTQLNRSYFDASLISGLSRTTQNNGGIIKIAYPTGRIDDKELEHMLYSALNSILKRYDGKVEIHLWKNKIPDELAGLNGIVLNKGTRNYDQFIKSFYECSFDIGLAPGVDTPFFHSKTNNKYREFGGCSIAGVYSNFPPYSNSVVNAETGLLAESSVDAWIQAIERLILDAELRYKIADNALQDVTKNYSFDNCVASWRQCFDTLNAGSPTQVDWLPVHKLIANTALVVFSNEAETRIRFFVKALDALPWKLGSYILFTDPFEYINSSWKEQVFTTLFVVDGKEQLETTFPLIPLSTSAILDLSCYRDDIGSALDQLYKLSMYMPVSVILSHETKISLRSDFYASFDVQSVNPNLQGLEQMFSLAGYPAVYLNLLEKSARHAPFKSSKINPLSKILRYLTQSGHRVKQKAFTIFTLLAWRSGSRKF